MNYLGLKIITNQLNKVKLISAIPKKIMQKLSHCNFLSSEGAVVDETLVLLNINARPVLK